MAEESFRTADQPLGLTGWAEMQLDAVDATVFSGEAYSTPHGRARLRWYMERWSRALDADEASDAAEKAGG